MDLAPSGPPFTSPKHCYAEMVPSAIAFLNDEDGSSFERISNFILRQFKIVPCPSHFTQVSRTLERITNNGILLLKNGLYKFAPILTVAAARAPLRFLMSSHSAVGFGNWNQNLVDRLNSVNMSYDGTVSGSVPTPATPVIVPTDVGRGRSRKVSTSAVRVEPTVIVLDEEDAAAQNNVGDGPPVSPVAKKARRVSGKPLAEDHVSKAKEPPRPTCKEVYEVISNVDGITDDEVMRAVKRFVNGKVDEFDMLKSLTDNRKKRIWILLLINDFSSCKACF